MRPQEGQAEQLQSGAVKASSTSARGSANRAKKRGSRLFDTEAKASMVRDQPQEAASAKARMRTRSERTGPATAMAPARLPGPGPVSYTPLTPPPNSEV